MQNVLLTVNYVLEQFVICSTTHLSKRRQVWRNETTALALAVNQGCSASALALRPKFLALVLVMALHLVALLTSLM